MAQTQNLPVEPEPYHPPVPVTVQVKDPDGREVPVTPKLYEALYKGRGWELVDPGSYTPPPGWEPPPALNNKVEAIGRSNAAALDPEQTAGAPAGKK